MSKAIGRPLTTKQMKAAWRSKKRIKDEDGVWWLSFGRARRKLRCSSSTLQKWKNVGCPYLDGAKLQTTPFELGFGRMGDYFLEAEIGQVHRKRSAIGTSPGNGIREASQLTGITYNSMRQRARREKYGLEGERTALARCKDGRLNRKVVIPSDLVERYRRDEMRSDELTLTEAAHKLRKLRVARSRVAKWLKHCQYLGRPLEHRELRKGKKPYIVVTKKDVEAIGKILRQSNPQQYRRSLERLAKTPMPELGAACGGMGGISSRRAPSLTVELARSCANVIADGIGLHEERSRQTTAKALTILPGGLSYKGIAVQLSGKPLGCVKELLDAQQHQLDWHTLRDRVWGHDAYTDRSTVKNAIADARDALRKLAQKAGESVSDPIPCVNQGKDLAWKLHFPG